jgi:hypothetical protein
MSNRIVLLLIVSLSSFLCFCSSETTDPVPTDTATVEAQALEEDDRQEWNNQIRREKFDIVLPEVMRKNQVDMWIHVMRETIPDPFGAEELGSTSGVFVFTDRGGDRIERAVLGRRWGDSHAGETWRVHWETKLVEECGAYDIVGEPVLVKQPPGGPETEYDYRFKGLRQFVEVRDPKCIALNYKLDLGPYPTTTRARDGLSYTDYLLLKEELGEKYAKRIVSSEFVMMDYIIRKVPSEIELLKEMRKEEDERVKKAFAEIVPGVTKNRDVGVTVFRRRGTGVSQRGRTRGHENVVIQGGDIVASPSQGRYAYVLREGETEPPPEIKKLWAEYKKIDEILAETIRVGLTPREIVKNYKAKFEEEGIIIRDDQLHLSTPKNDFSAFSEGFDPEKTHLNIDCHGMGKGARKRKFENYFGPRIGSNGPEWMWDITLPANHHFVLEYFIYMPWPSGEYEDQYLFWWNHEQALATESGVEYLSPPQEELYLITNLEK